MEMEIQTVTTLGTISTYIPLSNKVKRPRGKHRPTRHHITIPPFSLIVSIVRQMGIYTLMPLVRISLSIDDFRSSIDLMALAGGGHAMNVDPVVDTKPATGEMVPASVPNQSYLSAGRPPTLPVSNGNGNGSGSAPKSRRMSSSTSQARGKSGAIGTWET
jgi:hypothetical protein